ncbi:hypothetical protein BgiBS90_007035, partial [Biomphalaria glabrata]
NNKGETLQRNALVPNTNIMTDLQHFPNQQKPNNQLIKIVYHQMQTEDCQVVIDMDKSSDSKHQGHFHETDLSEASNHH